MYAWIITKDIIGEGLEGIGGNQRGSRCLMSAAEMIQHPEGRRFRMLDDDGEIYCEGIIVGGSGFEPLDDYGCAALGCTEIQLWTGAEWETL
jgi:hypothetical protein